VAVATAGALPWLDPVAAFAIAAIAAREGVELWRGEDGCCSPLGFEDPDGCQDDCCAISASPARVQAASTTRGKPAAAPSK
jgi:hypothetical protein